MGIKLFDTSDTSTFRSGHTKHTKKHKHSRCENLFSHSFFPPMTPIQYSFCPPITALLWFVPDTVSALYQTSTWSKHTFISLFPATFSYGSTGSVALYYFWKIIPNRIICWYLSVKCWVIIHEMFFGFCVCVLAYFPLYLNAVNHILLLQSSNHQRSVLLDLTVSILLLVNTLQTYWDRG